MRVTITKCYYCICKVCNRRNCSVTFADKSSWARCMYCQENFIGAITDCDDFEMKHKKHCYRVVRRGKTQREEISEKLDEILRQIKQ